MSKVALYGGISELRNYYSGQQCVFAGMTNKRDSSGRSPGINRHHFCLLGLQFMVLTLGQYFRGLVAEPVRGGAIAVVVVFVPGIILLRRAQSS